MNAGWLRSALYWARDRRCRRLFELLPQVVRGRVLDVGGGDFLDRAVRAGVGFERWVTLEIDPAHLPPGGAPRAARVCGDGSALPFADGSFDSVLALQVLEHVFRPLDVVDEVARVLRPGGHAVLLFPQTATLHLAPHHYQNFTRYWAERAAQAAGLEVVVLEAQGGAWSTVASRHLFFLLQAARVEGMVHPDTRRSPLFWLLLPFMVGVALVNIPVALLFSLADLPEEPNNHLVVVRKPHVP